MNRREAVFEREQPTPGALRDRHRPAAALLIGPEVAARESLASAFRPTLETLGRGGGGELRNRIGRGIVHAG